MRITILLLLFANLAYGMRAQEARHDTIIEKDTLLEGIEVSGYKRIEQADAKKSVFMFDGKLPKHTGTDVALQELLGIIKEAAGYRLAGNDRKCKLLIDGIEVDMENLKSLKASEVERVEIKNISVEGNDYAGEINIIRKRAHDRCLNSEVGVSSGILRSNNGGKASLLFRDDRIEISVDVDVTKHKYDKQISMYREKDSGEIQYFSSDAAQIVWQKYNSLRIGYQFSPRISGFMIYSYMGHQIDANEGIVHLNGTSDESVREETIANHSANAIFRFVENGNSRLFIKGRFHNYQNKYSVNLFPDADYKAKMVEYSLETVREMDSLKVLGCWHEANFGLRAIFRGNSPSGSEKLGSNIYMAYVNDQIKVTNLLSLYWQLKMEFVRYKLTEKYWYEKSLLPSFTVNYKMHNGRWILTGERYIYRPSVDLLNSNVFYTNEVVQTYGNTKLKSQYNNRVQLKYVHQLKKTILGTSASYRYISDMIDLLYDDNLNRRTYQNVGYGNITNISFSCRHPFAHGRLLVNISTGVSYYDYRLVVAYKPFAQTTGNAGWGYNSSMNISYVSTKDWLFILNWVINNYQRDMSCTITQRPNAIFSIRKSFLKDRLSCSMSFIQILGTKQNHEYRFRSAYERLNVITHISNINCSFTWNFGKKIQLRSMGTTISNDDISVKQ